MTGSSPAEQGSRRRPLREALEDSYGQMQRWISPSTRFSQVRYEEQLTRVLNRGTRWLDLGCGHQILPEWREAQEFDLVSRAGVVIGLDPDHSSLRRHRSIDCRVLGDAAHLPFRDASFELVTSNMVVEHLDRPEVQFAEICRILSPGGRFLFHTPNARAHTTRMAMLLPEMMKAPLVRVLEGRSADDVFPTYYRANTIERIAELATETGFGVEWIRPTTTAAATAMILPLALVELLWIRMLERPRFERWRQTLIVSLLKP